MSETAPPPSLLAERIANDALGPLTDLDAATRERVRTSVEASVATALRETDALHARTERFALVGRFAATLAHELRNPLSVIETSAFVISDRSRGDERTQRHARRIAEQVERIGHLVSDVVEIVRGRPAHLVAIDIAVPLRAAVARSPAPPGIHVELACPPALPPVLADVRWIEQAVLNLVLNAIDAMGAQGTLAVSAEAVAGGVRVRVRDDGPGITSGALTDGASTKQDGVGLGLGFVQRVLRAHHAVLAIEPVERGTSLTFVLAASPGHAGTTA